MKTPASKAVRKHFSARAYEEHVCAALAALCRNLSEPVHRDRFFAKFAEDEFAKLERLVELHVQCVGNSLPGASKPP